MCEWAFFKVYSLLTLNSGEIINPPKKLVHASARWIILQWFDENKKLGWWQGSQIESGSLII